MKISWLMGAMVLAMPFLGSGCMLMHAGMGDMMGHGGHQAGKTIIKEVEKDGLKIALEVPPLVALQESTLLVRIANATSGDPKSDVRVKMTVAAVEKHGSSHSETKPHPPLEFKVADGKDKGVYELKHKFEEPGSYEIAASVVLPEKVSSPINISVVQEVGHKIDSRSKTKTTTLLILGGVGMGLMMALMVL